MLEDVSKSVSFRVMSNGDPSSARNTRILAGLMSLCELHSVNSHLTTIDGRG
jgi:hypothetical protein